MVWFYLLLVIHTLYSIALHGTRPVVSLFANDQGASALEIGILVSSFALFPMLLALTIGKWLDRYGARKMTALGGSGMALALLLPIVFPHLYTLLVSQLMMGLSQICVLVSMQKTVGNFPGNRDKLIVWFSLTGSAGEFIGPLLNGFIYDHFGFQLSFGISMTFVLIALCAGLLLRRQAWKSGASTSDNKVITFLTSVKMLKHVNLSKAMITGGLVLYSKDLFVAYFPIYGQGVGLSPSVIGVLLSCMALMAIVIRLAQYWLVRTFGRGRVLMTTLLISGLAYILIPFHSSTLLLGLLAALMGIGLGLGQPLSLVYALNMSPEGRQGEVLGLRLTFNRGAQFTAPILFGGIGGAAGLLPIFWVSGALLLCGSYFLRIKPSAQDQKSESADHRKRQ